MDQVLTDAEVIDLTGAKLHSVQQRILRQHGIAFTVRLDGTVKTTWRNFFFPGEPITHTYSRSEDEPDFSVMK